MMRHVLVTNDFPPKIGGIQNYLWELWRRLPADSFAVYTTPHAGAVTFDAHQPFRVERSPEPVLGPYPWLVDRLNRFAEELSADLIVLDPAIPLGLIGPHLDRPFGVVLHGAEVTIPGRLPLSSSLLGHTLRSSSLVIAAGHYALAEAERCARQRLPSVVVPPGVDTSRFRPFDATSRSGARRRFGVDDDDFVVAAVSRLVPRKGMDTLVRAAAELERRRTRGSAPDGSRGRLRVLIGGSGRQRSRLQRLITALDAPVELLGRLDDDAVPDLYGAADVMAMLCRDRWFGLEQEGFGIVFLEAAAAGLPQIAGRSGGAQEAVVDGETGIVMADPTDVGAVADALQGLADDPGQRRRLARAARRRACAEFDYDRLARRLSDALAGAVEPWS